MKKLNSSFKFSKTTMLIPLFALTMHSCEDVQETAIVKDKIDNQVFLTPVNDTDYVYRVIDFDKAYKDRKTKNIYLNMNRGDTVVFSNNSGDVEIVASHYHHGGFAGTGQVYYKVISINGIHRNNLPDLVHKQKQDAEIKKLNEKYKNLQNSR